MSANRCDFGDIKKHVCFFSIDGCDLKHCTMCNRATCMVTRCMTPLPIPGGPAGNWVLCLECYKRCATDDDFKKLCRETALVLGYKIAFFK